MKKSNVIVATADQQPDAKSASPRGLSLRRNFVWTAAGNVTYAACQWGMLMALAKLGSPEMVGQFALGLAIGAPIMMLTSLQLRAVLVTDVHGEYRFSDYFALRLVSTVIAFVVIVAIAILAGYRRETAWVIAFVGLAKSVESISDILYGMFQKHERLDRIAIALMLRGVGSLAGFALTLWMTRRIDLAVVALAGWWGIVLLVFEYRAGKKLLSRVAPEEGSLGPAWNWPLMMSLVRLSLPLGAVMVLATLTINIPRYFVESQLGEAALGYFSALGYVMVAGYAVMGALGQSATPRLAMYYVSNRAAYRRLLVKMVLLALTVGASGILISALWGRILLTLLYRREYAAYSDVFVWVMIASAISYVSSMFGYGMTAARIFRPQVPLFASSCLGITIICALFLNRHGLIVGAIALAIGAGVSAIGGGGILFFRARLAGDHASPA